MLNRQPHLQHRQVQGRAFSEPVQIVRTGGHYVLGTYSETESTPTDTLCSTAPATANDARVRQLTEGGVQLEALRRFWTEQELTPALAGTSTGDVLIWGGQRWRVRSTSAWGSFSDTIGERMENQ